MLEARRRFQAAWNTIPSLGWLFLAFLLLYISGCNPAEVSTDGYLRDGEQAVSSPLIGQDASLPRSLATQPADDFPFRIYPCGEKKEFGNWKEIYELYEDFTRTLPSGEKVTLDEPSFCDSIYWGTKRPIYKRVSVIASALSVIPVSERTPEKLEQALATFPNWVWPKWGHFSVEYELVSPHQLLVKLIPGRGGNFECVYRNFWLGDRDYAYGYYQLNDPRREVPLEERWDYQSGSQTWHNERYLKGWFEPALVNFYLYAGRTPGSIDELLSFYELERNPDYPGIWNTLRFESWETGARISYRLPSSGEEVEAVVELADQNKRHSFGFN